MRWTDLLLLSLQNLWRRKLRTILTIVGVMIGTTSIVVMLSIGLGANKSILDQAMEQDNLTLITCYDNGFYGSGPGTGNSSNREKLDDAAIRDMEDIPDVIAITPVMQLSGGEIRTGKYMTWGGFTGIRPEAFAAFGIPILEGQPFAKSTTKMIEVAIGRDNKSNFQKARSSVWEQEPNIDWFTDKFTYVASYTNAGGTDLVEKEFKMKITGILGDADERVYSQFNYGIYTDIDVLKRLAKEVPKAFYDPKTDQYEQAWIKVDDYRNVERVLDSLREMYPDFSFNSDMEWINSIKQQSQSLQLLLGGIGAITMLVSAISIINTMLMSIYERTREIGVMKVLGCRLANISLLFLGEAGFIGLFGGAVGIGASYGLSNLLNYVFQYYNLGGYGNMQSYLPPWLSLMSLAFAVGVGIIAGLYPSQRAMRLSALAAIRNDV